MLIVEVPIHDQGPIGNPSGYMNFDQVGTNSAMTCVLVLSARVWRNELLR